VKLADELIADAKEVQRIYSERFHRQPIMIPYGAEVRDDHDLKMIQKLGLNAHSYYLLATRFVPENNPLFIIRNYLQSHSQRPLVVLGKNYYNSAYESEIRKIDDPRVLFLGHIADRKSLYEFYKYSYCYIHGHSVGGTNPTMLEALANSCCILALNTPFNKEMLGDGEFGRFFDLDEDSFVKQLDFIDTQPEYMATLRKKAITRITNYYNWESVADSYLKLFNSIHA
jgi:glycosyltransferase involved in cell wall biosynthesis